MSRFAATLFGASPFIRWSLTPVLLAFALVFPLIVPTREGETMGVVIMIGLEVLALSLLLGLWAPGWLGRMAFRIVCLVVFIGYAVYLVVELRGDEPLSKLGRRSESSPINAVVGMVVIGLPALRYAVLGRVFSGEEESSSEEDPNSQQE
jgi:predicted acyltransferase